MSKARFDKRSRHARSGTRDARIGVSSTINRPGGALTERQAECLAAIATFLSEKKYPPTTREFCKLVGITSPNGAVCLLKALERHGYIVRGKSDSPNCRAARGIQIVKRVDGPYHLIGGNWYRFTPVAELFPSTDS